MDVATRFEPRVRIQSYVTPDNAGNDSDSMTRRKFQRTLVDPNDPSEATFRKPSMPASAMRPQAEQQNNFSHRRRSTQHRDSVRVPSGPREFPSPGRRPGNGSISSLTPSTIDSANSTRSFLPHTTSEPLFSRVSKGSRLSMAHQSGGSADSPVTQTDRLLDNFEFLPSVNFDDFQNSLANYDGDSPLLSDFPAVSADRATPKETGTAMTRNSAFSGPKSDSQKPQGKDQRSLSRSQSLRRRLSAVAGPKQPAGHPNAKESASGQPNQLSFRGRRQSSMPQSVPPTGPAPPPPGAGTRAPRKSVGPGVLTSMMENRKSSQPLPGAWSESHLKPAMTRTASLSKASRRSTLHTAAPPAIDLPRPSTLTATTQSRQNKVKSLQPPPRDQDPGTPSSRSFSKGANSSLRATTPSSSGNKRQSTISGRASGLGARTISPTDARRLKRMSMMPAPPMPSNISKGPPTPQEEVPPVKLELPRMPQPNPSYIPRMTHSATPNSARASPEGHYTSAGTMSLHSKSSFQSLAQSASSQSRLPTARPRSVHSSSAQYGDEGDLVPPVPAIPRAYESPGGSEGSNLPGSLRSSHFGGPNPELALADFDPDDFMFGPASAVSNKSASELFAASRRKPSGEYAPAHKRTTTMENIERQLPLAGGQRSLRPQPDPAGRKNVNLQPLRLPPLNLAPINTPTTNRIASFPRPTQEVEGRDDLRFAQTPEPKRTTKTPSTPMTASKATFFRRHDDEFAKQKSLRSSSSHFALRDLLPLDDSVTKFFDDGDVDIANVGFPIPGSQLRTAITPFASGSLPKATSDYMDHLRRPSGEYEDAFSLGKFENLHLQSSKPQGPRVERAHAGASVQAGETPVSVGSGAVDPSQPESKEGGGLRRRLSFGWHRSSSKGAALSESKPSPPQDSSTTEKSQSRDQKRISEMPPPRLPASAAWLGDAANPPTSNRPSLDSIRRKSTAISINSFTTALSSNTEPEQPVAAPKATNLRSEQPQPVPTAASTGPTAATANRASSWGNLGSNIRPVSVRLAPNINKQRPAQPAHTISATAKDKDDHAADEEMRRLSQKRRDVDTAARESEELWKRANARTPMSPEKVLHDRNCALNIFERGEVMDYDKDGVYFTGTRNARKIVGSLTSLTNGDKDAKSGNYGYDDERGDYNIVLGDHLAYRYEVVDVLGKGSFGQVVRCVDHKDGGVVAVKIIRNKKRFHQQALVEVGILGRLREWDPDGTHATLSITSSFYFRSHLCIVTPCLSINLYELIRAHNFVGFSLPLIRRFARQLLACLVLLQDKRIIHCDLKPENILLCEARKADVRVIDFGSSCKEEEKVYTYIQSRFYRSPEVILGSTYGLGIDMWSFGCILAELWTGYPLFPGENEQEQLACIMEIFGPPDRHLVERCTRKKLFFDSVGKPRVTVSSKGRRRRPSSKTLSQALKTEDEAFLDFVTRCLRWDPDRRMKPHEAVNHGFITNQPLHQRPAIPDEARRAARLRPTAAVLVPATGGLPAPAKRSQTTPGQPIGNAFAQQAPQHQQQQQTPAKERRGLPETPQTTLRNGAPPPASAHQARVSPSKQLAVAAANRRHSTVNPAAGPATFALNAPRASNGHLLGTQRQGSGSLSGATLAQLAARESMGSANAARWKASS